MTVPYWLLLLAAACFGVRALFGLAALVDRVGGDGSLPCSEPSTASVYDWAKDDAT